MTFTISKSRAVGITDLPIEIVQKVYEASDDLDAVLNLSLCSHRFHAAFSGSQKLAIIEKVIEAQYGPLYDAVQLVTFNHSVPAHYPRRADMSLAMARKLVFVGRIVKRWETIYPSLRWRQDYENRRVLRTHEAIRFRRAMYRLWLYNVAFDCIEIYPCRSYSRPPPRTFGLGDSRVKFCRYLPNKEIEELTDLSQTMMGMIRYDITPDHGIIQDRYSRCFPAQENLDFRRYDNHLSRPNDSKLPLAYAVAVEAWDVYEAMELSSKIQKLTPDQLLYLRDGLQNRRQRQTYFDSLPIEFHQTNSTFDEVISTLESDRGCKLRCTGTGGGIVDQVADELHT